MPAPTRIRRGRRALRQRRFPKPAIALAMASVSALAVAVLTAVGLSGSPAPASPNPGFQATSTFALADLHGAALQDSTAVGGRWSLASLGAAVTRGGVRLSPRAGAGSALLRARNADALIRAAFQVDEEGMVMLSLRGSVGFRAKVRVGSGTARLDVSGGDRRGPVPLGSAEIPFSGGSGARLVVELAAVGRPATVVARAWNDSGSDPQVASVVAVDAAGPSAGDTVGLSVNGPPATLMRLEGFRIRIAGSAPAPSATASEPSAAPSSTPSAAGPQTSLPVGSLRPGEARYPVPSAAVVVSPRGNDRAPGTWSRPKRSIAAAVASAPRGSTVVVRGGVYHESVVTPEKSELRVQSAPGESVWLDGSRTVSGWTRSGATWSAPWAVRLDSSPTYTRGAPDDPGPSRGFIDPDRPLAAYPDQVWVGGRELSQAGSSAEVRPDRFFVDLPGRRLIIGTDPRQGEVRASDLSRAFTLRSPDSGLRGFGIRRFAPSVPDLGAVRVEYEGAVLENLLVEDSATTGVFVTGSGASVRRVSILRSGLIGMTANRADGLVVSSVRIERGNTEGFNMSPVSGGVKVTKSRGVEVQDSVFAKNAGPGIWFDESVYAGRVLRNRVTDSGSNGIVLEISSRMLVAGNLVRDSALTNLKINDTDRVDVWNNTFIGADRSVWVVQDARRASDVGTPGHDSRRPLPDPTVTWVTGSITLGGNVLAEARLCQLCVEDTQDRLTGSQLGVRSTANLFRRAGTGAIVSWPVLPGPPIDFGSLNALRAAGGDDSASVDLSERPIFEARDVLAPAAAKAIPAAAVEQPRSVLAALGATVRGSVGVPPGG